MEKIAFGKWLLTADNVFIGHVYTDLSPEQIATVPGVVGPHRVSDSAGGGIGFYVDPRWSVEEVRAGISELAA